MHDVLARPANNYPKTSAIPIAPALLLRPAAFFWLWSVPLGVLLALNLQGFWLVQGNLEPDQRRRALLFGVGGALNFLCSVAAYLAQRLSRTKKEDLPVPAIAW